MVGNQSPLPLIDLIDNEQRQDRSWESVTSPFDRLRTVGLKMLTALGISHLSL